MAKQVSPARMDTEAVEVDLERPKTPEAQVIMKNDGLGISPATLPFPFFPPFRGPSLIPPLHNPLFSHLPIPMPTFGHPGYLSTINRAPNFMQPCIPKDLTPPKAPDEAPSNLFNNNMFLPLDDAAKPEKKSKEHKKEKRDKIKKKNKKDKNKEKSEKRKLKEEKKDKEKIKKEKKDKKKEKEVNISPAQNFCFLQFFFLERGWNSRA